MNHILVVDDDPHIRDVICFALDKADYTYSTAGDGAQALSLFDTRAADLVVLDIGLPEMDGLEVCRQIRKGSDIPILFLSARDDEIDRILGLEIGADDYVTKPFSPRELIARIGVILRRQKSSPTSVSEDISPIAHGLLQLDPLHRLISYKGAKIDMTSIQFDILTAMLKRPRQIFTREQIIAFAYPSNIHVSDRTIDSHIRNIRAKLRAHECGNVIETVHGFGFRLGPCQPIDE